MNALNRNEILDFATAKRTPSAEELAGLSARFPYFTAPIAAAAAAGAIPADEQGRRLRMRLAIATGDADALAAITGQADDAGFYGPEAIPTHGTDDTIDTFLSRYGRADAAETDALTRLIFSPVASDYATAIEAGDAAAQPAPADSTMAGIDSFLSSHPAAKKHDSPAPERPKPAPEPEHPSAPRPAPERPLSAPENSSLSESLAKIMIKNHNYTKALEIITRLSLNNPEKITYFADQIRFLKKLIINDKKR